MAIKAHVMVIPYPVQGHINPMVQFSKRLASKGLRVTLVTTTAHTKLVLDQSKNPILVELISNGFNEGEKPDSIDAFVDRFRTVSSRSLPELIDKLKNSGHPVKAIVYDSFMPWVLDIAKDFGIYGASFFTQSCAVSAIYYHTNQGFVESTSLEKGSLISLPSMPPLEMGDLPSFVSDLDSYPGVLKLVLNRFSNVQEANCLLFNTFDKLEDELVKWMASQWPIKTIGPTIPSMYLDKQLADDKDYGLSLFKPEAEACIEWLDARDNGSVVYVSFGSLATLGEEHMDELAAALLSSNCYFLWVVRDTEQSKLPSNFMDKAARKGLIVNWCPQLEVLAHKAVGSFMTHCGWNSTIEALSLGVPMLVMPQWTDQTTNAKFIVDVWRTGVRVKVMGKETVTREDIAACIKDVMEGTKGYELRANAVRWKELAFEAMNEGGSSNKNIDKFVLEIVGS